MIAKDNAGQEKQSETITFNTGIYLYNNGDECTSVTGGWQKIYKGVGPDYAIPSASSLKLSKNDKYMVFTISNEHGAIGPTNKIDISNYKFMCTTMTAKLINYNMDSVCLLAMDNEDKHYVGPEGDWVNGNFKTSYKICYENPITSKQNFKWNIETLKGNRIPTIFLQTSSLGGASFTNIYEVYLLK